MDYKQHWIVATGVISIKIQGGKTAFKEVFMKKPELSWPLGDRDILNRF